MQTLGKYQLIAEIARGGMGIVYLAVANGPAGFSKLFVIKELKPELVEDASFLDMFLEEARLAARLSHPNIVTTYEVGAEGNRPFIVMDYLDGESLGRILRKKSPLLTPAMHLRLLCHALDGLDYAHHLTNFDDTAASVVHRDMSPQNVFVTFDGQVKIVDFGIAKASDTSIETKAGIFKGKPGYMAPEQLNGDVDTRADLFSVGVMMWEAIAGRRMWQKKSEVEILTALIKGEIPSLDEVRPDADPELRRICARATARDPDARYAEAREMRLDLEAYLESQNERTTVREISQIIGVIFAEQRKKMRALLEKCIAEAKELAPISKLPSLAPPPLETTTPPRIDHTMQMLRAATASASAPAPAAIESGPSISVVATMASGTPISQAMPDGSTYSLVQPADEAKPTKRRSTWLLLVAAALVLASVLATLLVLRMTAGPYRSEAAMSATSPPPSQPAPSASPASAPSASAAATAAAAPETTDEAASAKAAARAPATAPPAPRPRVIYVPAPAPRPAAAPPAAPAVTTAPPEKPAASSKTDCNPPFYFEGSKKVFKPGCL